MSATELVLVRHGETAWNRARRIQGHIDIALNEVGHQQAWRTGRRLALEPIAGIVSSDLARARQTAAAIAQACGLPVEIDLRLRERAFGAFEGRDHAEIERDCAADYARWKAREPDFALPGGGESLSEFQARVEQVLGELAERFSGARVVVVTHGGVLDAAYRMGSGLALTAPRTFDLLNASLNRLHRVGGRFQLGSWADVSHLSASLDDVEPDARRARNG